MVNGSDVFFMVIPESAMNHKTPKHFHAVVKVTVYVASRQVLQSAMNGLSSYMLEPLVRRLCRLRTC